MGERIVFSADGVGTVNIHARECKWTSLSLCVHKPLKMDQRLKSKSLHSTLKLLQWNLGINLTMQKFHR